MGRWGPLGSNHLALMAFFTWFPGLFTNGTQGFFRGWGRGASPLLGTLHADQHP